MIIATRQTCSRLYTGVVIVFVMLSLLGSRRTATASKTGQVIVRPKYGAWLRPNSLIMVQCKVSGADGMLVFHGKTLLASGRNRKGSLYINIRKLHEHTYMGNLVFHNASRRLYGNYTCTGVKNGSKVAEATFRVARYVSARKKVQKVREANNLIRQDPDGGLIPHTRSHTRAGEAVTFPRSLGRASAVKTSDKDDNQLTSLHHMVAAYVCVIFLTLSAGVVFLGLLMYKKRKRPNRDSTTTANVRSAPQRQPPAPRSQPPEYSTIWPLSDGEILDTRLPSFSSIVSLATAAPDALSDAEKQTWV